jgi:hypothetical protein
LTMISARVFRSVRVGKHSLEPSARPLTVSISQFPASLRLFTYSGRLLIPRPAAPFLPCFRGNPCVLRSFPFRSKSCSPVSSSPTSLARHVFTDIPVNRFRTQPRLAGPGCLIEPRRYRVGTVMLSLDFVLDFTRRGLAPPLTHGRALSFQAARD